MDVEAGQIVISRAGRDKDKRFLIYKILDESYVLVVDGNLRKIQKPKKKKIKHLILTQYVVWDLKQKISKELEVSDSEVRLAIMTHHFEQNMK